MGKEKLTRKFTINIDPKNLAGLEGLVLDLNKQQLLYHLAAIHRLSGQGQGKTNSTNYFTQSRRGMARPG
jgi:hypothetical protein